MPVVQLNNTVYKKCSTSLIKSAKSRYKYRSFRDSIAEEYDLPSCIFPASAREIIALAKRLLKPSALLKYSVNDPLRLFTGYIHEVICISAAIRRFAN